MIKVQLTEAEMIICKMLGNMRTLAARSANVKDAGISTSLETDEDGVIAEMAFCKHWNIFFDPEASPRKHSYDCILKGKRIDIKSTRYQTGRLLATKKINPDIDIFVLALIEGCVVSFVGYATADELYQDANLIDLGRGVCYVMRQEDLREWK